jgi:FlaA1/EpsC-like NDP-sugar epimerase
MTLGKFSGSALFRVSVLAVSYTTVLFVCRWLAFQLRFDFSVPPEFQPALRLYWAWALPVKLVFLLVFGQFSGLLSYFSIPDLKRLVAATGCGSAAIFVVYYLGDVKYASPRGVLLVDFLLSTMGLACVRLALRMARERFAETSGGDGGHRRRVAIVGAGDVGANLGRELLLRHGLGRTPVAFFDDDKGLWRSRVHGIPVVGPPESLRDHNLNLQLEEVIIAMPSAPAKRIGEIVRVLQAAHLRFTTVPSVDQLASGRVRVSQLRSVEIQDLLGRTQVELETENIKQLLRDRVVMVTGAGGSIGSELCRQISTFDPQRLLLVEQSEVQMFQIEQEMIERGAGGTIVTTIADILDDRRMSYLFRKYQPAVVFHAAAHKHVPLMESQPSEAIKNNILGSAHLATLARDHHVDRFVLISTDKAINPTNVMGASKRVAELYVQALQASDHNRTRFMAVRFGNVLGSSGSVVPIFRKQIAAGGPVRVTHPEATRYFMTIPEAVGLVLQTAALGEGGEIFILDMGKPIRIVDLARQLIELSGLRPDQDIEIQYTGLRPGEKLFEELSHAREDVAPTAHPKIMRLLAAPMPVATVQAHLDVLRGAADTAEPDQLKALLRNAVPEYTPYLT